jgi:hypothetical protein
MRSHYQIEKFKKKNPAKFNNLMSKIIANLSESEKAVSSGKKTKREGNLNIYFGCLSIDCFKNYSIYNSFGQYPAFIVYF